MFDNTRKYAVENVIASYRDFIEHRTSGPWGESQHVRKGINAAAALYHLREHLPENVTITRAALASKCPDYDLLGDIANAAKHQVIDRGSPQVETASQIAEALIVTFYSDDQGQYTGARVEIVVTLNDGTRRYLAEVLHNVASMWRDELDAMGIVDLKPFDKPALDGFLSRDEAAQSRGRPMSMTAGEGYNWHIHMYDFNSATGLPVPKDLTGATITFRVRRLPTSVPFEISVPTLDLTFDFDVPLTSEQANEYLRQDDTNGQEEYVKSLVMNDPALVEEMRALLEQKLKESRRFLDPAVSVTPIDPDNE